MRHRSLDEIIRYAQRHEQVRFVTSNAFAYGSDGIHPRFDKVERLMEKIQAPLYFGTFPSEVRPEWICDTSLDLVTKYCTNTKLHFGAQSGSNRVLAHLHRGHNWEDVTSAVGCCTDHGITPIVDFILGFPFETDDDQRETVTAMQWVARYGQVHAHRFVPLPNAACRNPCAIAPY